MSDSLFLFFIIVVSCGSSCLATIAFVDKYVQDLPIEANYLICETQGSRFYSWDASTATCENGFQFDLIKEQAND